MLQEQIIVDCHNNECPHFSSCCKLPTEYYSDTGTVDIMFIGQGAGKEEETKGRPFVGPAGKRLRQLIKYAWDFNNSFSIALTNNVRCHPLSAIGKDRAPTSTEIKECRGHLIRDIDALKPKVIMPVGNSAMGTFFNDSASMTKLHGKQLEAYGITKQPLKIIPTYHPSYIIRTHGHTFDASNLKEYDKVFINDLYNALSQI